MRRSLTHNKKILLKLLTQLETTDLLSDMHENLCTRLKHPVTYGIELEFYLIPEKGTKLQLGHPAVPLKNEKGLGQYEFDLGPFYDPIRAAQALINAKESLVKYYQGKKIGVNFASKPFNDDYGSALHIHICVGNKNIDFAASCLCHYLKQSMLCFAFEKDDYSRFDHRFMAPTHIAYGNNNRTSVVRTPDSFPRRLEHRVSSASANIYLVLFAIIRALSLGIENPKLIKQYSKLYGNAFDPQYELEVLPKTISDANKYFEEKFFSV